MLTRDQLSPKYQAALALLELRGYDVQCEYVPHKGYTGWYGRNRAYHVLAHMGYIYSKKAARWIMDTRAETPPEPAKPKEPKLWFSLDPMHFGIIRED